MWRPLLSISIQLFLWLQTTTAGHSMHFMKPVNNKKVYHATPTLSTDLVK